MSDSNSNGTWTPSLGEKIELHGLVNAPHLNGKHGFVATGLTQNGRYGISMRVPWVDPRTKEVKNHQLSLKPTNIRPIPQYHIDKSKKLHMIPCENCGGSFDRLTMKKCSKCRFMNYCSKECQTNHWRKVHKEDCAILARSREGTRIEHKGDRCFVKSREGMKLLSRGKYAEAEILYRSLIFEDGLRTISTWSMLAQSVYGQLRVDEAIEWYLTATNEHRTRNTEDDDHLTEAYVQLGFIYQNLKKDFGAAKDYYRKALEITPHHSDARAYLSQLEA